MTQTQKPQPKPQPKPHPKPHPKQKTPTIDADAPLPDIGMGRVSGDRFHSPEIMQKEWTHMFRRVWNMGPRVEEFTKPGDYVLQDLGKESFIFILGTDEKIRCFYNVCQHRGNRLLCAERSGNVRFFKCQFHAWSWNIDGSIKGVPDAHSFPQFKEDGMPKEELGLNEVQADTWGGWVWYNIDGKAGPLQDYLDVLPEHIAPYEMQDMRMHVNATFLWDCNWKVACDAFNESYHFRGIHPEMMTWSNSDAKLELLGIHSRMINEYGAPSEPYRDTMEISERMKSWMKFYGMDAEAYEGPAKECRIAKQKFARSLQEQGLVPQYPYEQMNDEQLSDIYHYFYFPNVAMNKFPEGINAFRYRPHETDPGKCYYDLIMIAHFPEGEVPQISHQYFDKKIQYVDVMDPSTEIATFVLQQDADNAPFAQQGLQSEGFKGCYLGDQEIRVRHFHNTMDKYLDEELD